MTRNLSKFPAKLQTIQLGVSPRSDKMVSDRKAKRNRIKQNAQNPEDAKNDDFDDIR